MPRFWDFECPEHGAWEVLLDEAPPDAIYCPACSAVSRRVWTHAPMVGGKEKGIYPFFSVQLGTTVESRKHEAELLVNHPDGPRVKVGVDEWKRQALSYSEPTDVLDAKAKAEFRECAEKAYHDVETRAIPLVDHPSIEDVEAGPIIVPGGKE